MTRAFPFLSSWDGLPIVVFAKDAEELWLNQMKEHISHVPENRGKLSNIEDQNIGGSAPAKICIFVFKTIRTLLLPQLKKKKNLKLNSSNERKAKTCIASRTTVFFSITPRVFIAKPGNS